MGFSPFVIIKTSLPRDDHGGAALLHKIVELLKQSQPIGCVGPYAAVYDLNETIGGWTPLPGAQPTLGTIGTDEQCASWMFTTYADAAIPKDKIEKFIADLAAIYPWEQPLIELTTSQLWLAK